MYQLDIITHDEDSRIHAEHLLYLGTFEREGIWIRRLNGKPLPSKRAVDARHRRYRIARDLIAAARAARLNISSWDGHLVVTPERRAAADPDLLAALHRHHVEIAKILPTCRSSAPSNGPQTGRNQAEFQGNGAERGKRP